MKKVLNGNEEIVIEGKGMHVNLAVLEGDVTYQIGSDSLPDDEACVLNEDIRTDRIFIANLLNKNIFLKAGSNGAIIQYRLE